MRRARLIALALLLCILAQAVWAGGAEHSGVSMDGSWRTFGTVTEYPEIFGMGRDAEMESRVRVRLTPADAGAVYWEVAWEAALLWRDHGGAPGSTLGGSTAGAYRVSDPDETVLPRHPVGTENVYVLQNLDRASVRVEAGPADFTIGRQAIAFGAAHVVNPTDVLAPRAFTTLAAEERRGVDAARVRYATGPMSGFDAGVVLGPDADMREGAAFLRYHANSGGADVTGTLMEFRENLLVGVDMARSLGGASVWVEAAHVHAGAAGGTRTPEHDYSAYSVGADYALADGLYGSLEYHMNGAGGGEPGAYLLRVGQTAYTEAGVYLLGRHYLAPMLTYEVTGLVQAGVQAVVNLGDRSALLAPSVEYNAATDVYLGLGCFMGVGHEPSAAGVLQSEFGTYPDVWYASASLYF